MDVCVCALLLPPCDLNSLTHVYVHNHKIHSWKLTETCGNIRKTVSNKASMEYLGNLP